jgi:murein DD-endopeptidase MepM/ murein hydrolase activator NlpD
MVGLALSMGATSLLMPRQNDGAAAAESKTPEVSPSSVSRVAALPSEPSIELPTVSPSELEVAKHTVRDGQTLQQIADLYRVTIESLAAANNLAPTASLRARQVLRIPAAEPISVGAAQSPQVLALADINRLPAPSDASHRSTDQLRTERGQALSRLRQERSKLKETLAELRREELRGADEGSTESPTVTSSVVELAETDGKNLVESPAVSETTQSQVVAELPRPTSLNSFPSIATLPSPVASPTTPSLTVSPSPELNWMQANPSLVLPKTEAGVVPQSTEPVEMTTANSLVDPAQIAARPEALAPSPSPLSTAPIIDAVPEAISYQVNPGDTIARIARTYNIPQSELIAANRLNDPNMIFVGQTLRLPGSAPAQSRTLPSVLPIADSASEPSRQLDTVSLPTAQPSVDAARSVAALPSSLLPAEATTLPSGLEPPNPPSVGGSNPYVQGLLSEIRTLQGRRSQQRADSQPVSVAAVSSTEAESLRNSAVSETRSINIRRPEAVQPEAVQAAPRRVTPRQSTPAVVAAAPLGSESYEPLLQPITGRMVSPDLPALPDADRFLPNGSFQGYAWPARGVLSSGYGWRWGRMHHGIDIAADVGTPIYAAAGGVIEYAGWNSGGYGNMIEIRHSDGSMTRYAHLNAIYVQVGQRVGQSEQIGEMGSTGYSTGPHLHFEVHLANQGTVNPMAYLPAE